ncbi:MAG: MlaD family protein [Alphaproteobacteria bacterium]|nr:MlaD family protein [Alphaproteobacteria bacterium]
MIPDSDRTETIIGALVLAFAFVFFVLVSADRVGRRAHRKTYEVSAVFPRADGLAVGSYVLLSGVHIGKVSGLSLEQNFGARVSMAIKSWVKLPADSSAAIETDGLLGAKFIEISAGGDDEYIHDNGFIVHTQGSLLVDELLARITSMVNQNIKKGQDTHEAQPH